MMGKSEAGNKKSLKMVIYTSVCRVEKHYWTNLNEKSEDGKFGSACGVKMKCMKRLELRV